MILGKVLAKCEVELLVIQLKSFVSKICDSIKYREVWSSPHEVSNLATYAIRHVAALDNFTWMWARERV